MYLAYDEGKSNELFYNNTSFPAQSIVPPGIVGNMPDFKNPWKGPNLELAKKTLAEADVDILSPKEGYVGAYKRFVEFGEVSFSYSTINYWVQNIKWSKPKIKESVSDGRKAFTIAEQLKNIKEQEEREMAERLEEIKNRKKSDE